MSSPVPFEVGASLARISATPMGWQIDTRGPRAARRYDFTTAGATAEFAITLRDTGNWPLRFGPGTEEVRAIIDELTEEGAE